jgi:hypothetical protein
MDPASIIMIMLMSYQTAAPEFRHNSLYTFNIDPTDGTVIIMNTQTGHLSRCTKELECSGEFKGVLKRE